MNHLTTRRSLRPSLKNNIATLAIATSAALFAHATYAQDAGALVDKLVKKGILSDQEAEEVRADMMRDFTQTSAGKINLSSSITKLKLYGDFRYRYQYEDREQQVANPDHISQRSRHRFRLTLAADVELADNFYAGFALQTGQPSDGALQTFENGFDDYNIFISKAFLGWRNNWLDVTVGKVKNPYYTTDLVWDPDITPNGLFEQVAFHKLFDGAAGPSGDPKDGKAMPPPEPPPWELTLVAGQMIFDDNNEFAVDSDLSTDAYLFTEQLVATYRFNKDTSITVAPGFMSFTAADLSGLTRTNAFTDAAALPPSATYPAGLPAISGETRSLHILTAPGDFSFKLGKIKTKLYWDFAYNFTGQKRFEDIYQLGLVGRGYRTSDSIAWLVGLQFGELKKKGDWSALLNYRETGIAAVDPNLNDGDFALGELNMRGFKLSLGYALSDAVIFSVTGYFAWNLDDNLRGGRAANIGQTAPLGGAGIAESNAVNVIQVDLAVKF